MGLDTTHGAWHGAYSAFMRWRRQIARAAGFPPLDLMEGFFSAESPVSGNPFWKQYEEDKKSGFVHDGSVWASLPISWEYFKNDPLTILLHHSDCDGEIAWEDCGKIADRLESLIPLLPQGNDAGHIGNWRDKTQTFVDGLREAFRAKENLEFH